MHNTQLKISTLNKSIPTVRSLVEAEKECFDYDAVLTAGPNKYEVAFGHPVHKIVEFRDSTHISSGGPTMDDVLEMLDFGINVPKLLVHCHAGISRSTAMAWGIAIGNGVDAEEAIFSLKKAQPTNKLGFVLRPHNQRPFSPNGLIVHHLQEIFNFKKHELLKLLDKYRTEIW